MNNNFRMYVFLILVLAMNLTTKANRNDTTAFYNSVNLVEPDSIRIYGDHYYMEYEAHWQNYPEVSAFFIACTLYKDSVFYFFPITFYNTLDSVYAPPRTTDNTDLLDNSIIWTSQYKYYGIYPEFHSNDNFVDSTNFNGLSQGLYCLTEYLDQNTDSIDQSALNNNEIWNMFVIFRGKGNDWFSKKDGLQLNLYNREKKILDLLKEYVSDDIYKQLEFYITSIAKYHKNLHSMDITNKK